MIGIASRLADRMLSVLVPNTEAAAEGCAQCGDFFCSQVICLRGDFKHIRMFRNCECQIIHTDCSCY
ncbi:hypothetical protein [Pseudonocardia sp. TRM90224]|uniref:hypothetical protein n=1 Tax=Pseudonocardia sp. TRM90224 TaxID=2812678 RepID=UPI001E4F123B|nr:hypothetical protein [Pseudonocardia sp. TRM90224]